MINQQNQMVFCTLFDSNYLDKGLALYHSMAKNIVCFRLYILAFDNKTLEVLEDMKLKNVVLISREEILTDTLKRIEKERSRAEFCWTCTPVLLDHVLSGYQENICTYIDADIYFYSNPINIIEEVIASGCSVGLVGHKYERDSEYGMHVFEYGKFCVQFNTFLNNKDGMQILTEWKKECIDWCYNICEEGRFGDQKYLDNMIRKYSCVHEVQALGAGVAPWNLHRYSNIRKKKGKVQMIFADKYVELIFYHFHGLKALNNNFFFLNIWKPNQRFIRKKIEIIYQEYLKEMQRIRKDLDEGYGILFQDTVSKRELLRERNYTLHQFCMNDGIILGIKNWLGQYVNNIIDVREHKGKKLIDRK